MEIEAKFRVDDDTTFTTLRSMPDIGQYTLVALPEPQQQHNTYFDTADGKLRVGRYGLRVRDLGDQRIATLKGGGKIQDELHQRDEWEQTIGPSDHPADWPAGELRDRVLALLGGADLLPIVTVRTTRWLIYAQLAAVKVAELCLDQGTITNGAASESFRELEIELLDHAARADFDQLVALLRARLPLTPEPRSKLARGLALGGLTRPD